MNTTVCFQTRYSSDMSRGDLTDTQWQRREPLLPEQRPAKSRKGGRPAEDHRRSSNGMLRIDRTGALWRDLPTRYGPWATAATRRYHWTMSGLWDSSMGGVPPCLRDTMRWADATGRVQP